MEHAGKRFAQKVISMTLGNQNGVTFSGRIREKSPENGVPFVCFIEWRAKCETVPEVKMILPHGRFCTFHDPLLKHLRD